MVVLAVAIAVFSSSGAILRRDLQQHPLTEFGCFLFFLRLVRQYIGIAIPIDIIGIDITNQIIEPRIEKLTPSRLLILLAGIPPIVQKLRINKIVIDHIAYLTLLKRACLKSHDPISHEYAPQVDEARVVGVIDVDLVGEVRDVLAGVALPSDVESPVRVLRPVCEK